jgi:predicted anti-sigma-YlaC factor YlaD
MSQNGNHSSCAAFQSQLPELIASAESIADHPHIKECELCRALLLDLETIAAAARQLFPVVEPADDLWEQIELAIESEEATSGKHSTVR